MKKSICGIDCEQCPMKQMCSGCLATGGHPFGGSCMIARCCETKGCERYGRFFEAGCKLKEDLIMEINALELEGMETVADLTALRGAFVNLEYKLPGGQSVKFWDDDRIYLGYQVCKKNSDRCYGITADEQYLMVSEYGENGTDPEVIVYKKWR